MKDQARIRPAFALCVVAATGLLLAVALIASRFSKHAPPPADAAALASVATTVEPVAEPEAPPAAPTPTQEAGMRPETALLQSLPKVQVTRAPNSPLSDLKVSFKLDSRLTQSLYMGDRWLAPPTYLQVGKGDNCIVEASIRGLNERGKAVSTPATWQVDDPQMVEMSLTGPGNTVELRVVRPGQTTIEVSSQGITKRLPLHARRYGPTLMVALAQQ